MFPRLHPSESAPSTKKFHVVVSICITKAMKRKMQNVDVSNNVHINVSEVLSNDEKMKMVFVYFSSGEGL